MKKIKHVTAIIMLMAMAMASGTASASDTTAKLSRNDIYVDGKATQLTAYLIGGNNYVQLREIGAAVDFGVDYDTATKTISIDSGKPYAAHEAAAHAPEEAAAIPSSQKIHVDGNPADMAAYNINGNNYVKLRDVAKSVDFGLEWDSAAKAVRIDTKSGYTEEAAQPPSGSDGAAITVPQSDAVFRPAAGTVIRTDSGELYTITGQKPDEPALPEPTCDWSQFPAIPDPKVTATIHDVKIDGTKRLNILNLHETRRMQYTLYNLIGGNPATWENGTIKTYKGWKSEQTYPVVTVDLGTKITTKAQVFWPFRESEVRKVFESVPDTDWTVVAYDQYVDGEYHITQYYIELMWDN